MIELFNKFQTTSYFYSIRQKIIDEIMAFTDEKILSSVIEELEYYYLEKNKIIPIVLYTDRINREIIETKVEKETNYYRTNQKTMLYDGVKITYKIPFTGDSDLLFLVPSKHFSIKFFVDDILFFSTDEYSNIIYSQSFTNNEIDIPCPDILIKTNFDNEFNNYIETINRINNEIEQYNNTLPSCITHNLEERKKRASKFIALAEKLSIPLKIDPNAPVVKPITLKKVQLKQQETPALRTREVEYAIDDIDYENIKSIINLAGSSMERTVKTFNKLEEEELRDIIISHLNIVYMGTVTGETFTRKGKSDIYIYFDNKAAFIAECKIWHGEKNLQEAINQLFSYTTWRDVKVSIIIFNKENKDFEKLLTTINSFLDNNDLCKNKTLNNKNEWLCKFIKDKESTQIINIHLIVFDIYI